MPEDQALDQLRQILSRPEFHAEESQPWWAPIVAPILEWLFGLYAQLARTVGDAASGREGWIGLLVLLLSGAVLALVVLYLARSIRLAVLRESAMLAESQARRRERSDQLWAAAQRHAAAGEWAAAVRAAYLSALYALDEHALLQVQSGLTNREHATQLVREHPEFGATFAELVQRYDRLRYGHYPVNAEAFSELSQLVSRARSATT